MFTEIEKQKVIELYNSFIDHFKNEVFTFHSLTIKYKGRVRNVEFNKDDIAHYFEVIDSYKPEYTYIVASWLFSKKHKNLIVCELKFAIEGVYNNRKFEPFYGNSNYQSFFNESLLLVLKKDFLEENYEDDNLPSLILREGSSMIETYFLDFLVDELTW